MKIYLTTWDNGMSYGDHNDGIGSAYTTEELAKQAVKMLEDNWAEEVAEKQEKGHFVWESMTYSYIELEVHNKVYPIKKEI